MVEALFPAMNLLTRYEFCRLYTGIRPAPFLPVSLCKSLPGGRIATDLQTPDCNARQGEKGFGRCGYGALIRRG